MPSLILTSMKPVEPSEGFSRAVACSFVETAGFGGAAELRFARDPQEAALVDGNDNFRDSISIHGDAIPLEYSAGETLRIKAEWS
jgi:hypothetical protein